MGIFFKSKQEKTDELILNLIDYKNKLTEKKDFLVKEHKKNNNYYEKIYKQLESVFGKEKYKRGVEQDFIKGDSKQFVEAFLGQPHSKKKLGGRNLFEEYRYDYKSGNIKLQFGLRIIFDEYERITKFLPENEDYIYKTDLLKLIGKLKYSDYDIRELNSLNKAIKFANYVIRNLKNEKLSYKDVVFDKRWKGLTVKKEKLNELSYKGDYC